MPPLIERYSVSEFIKQWCAETGDGLVKTGEIIATAIAERRLIAVYPYPSYEDPNPYGAPVDDDYSRMEEFKINIESHLRRLAVGLERPDFDDLLQHVSLLRSDVEEWLQSMGRALPKFWRPAESEGRPVVGPQQRPRPLQPKGTPPIPTYKKWSRFSCWSSRSTAGSTGVTTHPTSNKSAMKYCAFWTKAPRCKIV